MSYVNIKSGALITDETYNKLDARLKSKYEKSAKPVVKEQPKTVTAAKPVQPVKSEAPKEGEVKTKKETK